MGINEMKIPPQNFQLNHQTDNRYHHAQQVWDQRIGDARVQAANWRTVAFITLFICIILSVGIIYIGSQSKIRPYMVRIQNDGSASNTGPIAPNFTPELPEIKYFLSQFVQNTQSLPLDPVVAKKNWLTAYNFLRPAAAAKMNSIVNAQSPFSQIGKQTREVEINVVAPITQKSYQVRWKTTVYDDGGNQVDQYNVTGMFTIDLATPTDEKTLQVNPLGLYIRDFNFAKENN